MDVAKLLHVARALGIVRSRRALSTLLAGITAGGGLFASGGTEVAARKKKKRKKKKCKNCGPCKSCVKGKCQDKLNGTICGDNCEECIAGQCGDPACNSVECLPNRTCAFDCDPEVQDCPINCLCTGGTVDGPPYCTPDPLPACTGLTPCTSTAACPSGHVCQECDGADRCVPVCQG